MKEKDFIREYMAEYAGGDWYYKIPDNKFTGKKPFDVFGYTKKGKPFAYEFKFHKALHRWPYSKVIPFQEQSLYDVSNLLVDAQVILGVKLRLTKAQQVELDRSNSTVDMVIRWPITAFKSAKFKETHFDVKEFFKEWGNGDYTLS